MSGIELALWNEKYRPRRLRDIIGQEEPKAALMAFARRKSMPELLLLGPPGTAKATSALCLASELYGGEMGAHFLELDSAGKDVLPTIKEFAGSKPVGGGVPFKAAFLRQLEDMDQSSQQSLRRVMERTAATCRFIFTAQYKDRIIGAIQSRCLALFFQPYPSGAVQSYLAKILEGEGIAYDVPGLRRIADYADGDLRLAIDLAQAVAAARGKISSIAVYQITDGLYPQDVKQLFELAGGGDFEGSRMLLRELLVVPGYSGPEILKQLQMGVLRSGLELGMAEALMEAVAEADTRIAQGGESEVQISALLAKIAANGAMMVGRRGHLAKVKRGV
jgi:DNA polymerase III delta prime subunit